MGKRILLADDSITIQKVVELTFSEGDYEVYCVGNGAQAIRKVEEVVPDIALVDVMMPQRNGYEVCSHIKQDPKLSWIPVLLLTGTFEPFDPRRAEQSGANGHITKPFESRALVTQVEDLLAAHPRPHAEKAERAPIAPSAAPDIAEVVNAGQILTPTAGPERDQLRAPAEPPDVRESSPATVRLDSRAFFAKLQAGDVLEAPATHEPPSSLGPLDLGSTAAAELEPTHPLRAVPGGPEPVLRGAVEGRVPSHAAAPSAGGVSSQDVSRILDEKIESLVRPILKETVERILREVAWEVIPEIAEALVRRRIRELESEAAGADETAPPLH